MKSFVIADMGDRDIAIKEVQFLAYLNCEEIINCIEHYEHKRKIYMIFEFMEAGPISNLIKKSVSGGFTFSEDFCKYTLYKITKALDNMHSKNILHRDFNSTNVHFDIDGSIKLTDMSRATNLTEQS